MKCSKCNFENDNNNKFCTNCGHRLSEKLCPKCGFELKENQNFCLNCGEKNPFKKNFAEENAETKKPILSTKMERIKMRHGRMFHLVFVVLISLIAFGVSFTGITSNKTYTWLYEDSEYEFIDFTVNQNPIQIYRGYFDVMSISNERELNKYQENISEEVDDRFEDYKGTLTDHDYSNIFSGVDLFGYQMAWNYDLDTPFISTIDFFVTMVILIVLQMIPLYILGISVYRHVNYQKTRNIENLFLLGTLFGILLSFFVPNILSKSVAGIGLVMYIAFMSIGFLVLKLMKLYNKGLVQEKRLLIRFADVIVVVIMLFLAFGSFIRVGYKDTPSRIYWGDFKLSESIELIDVYNENFKYSTSDIFYAFNLSIFDDSDLSSANKTSLADIENFSYLFMYRVFDSSASQDIFIGLVIVVSIVLVTTLSLLFYARLKNIHRLYEDKHIFVFKLIIIISLLILFILSIIASINVNSVIKKLDLPMTVRVSIGIIFAIVLSVISLIASMRIGNRKIVVKKKVVKNISKTSDNHKASITLDDIRRNKYAKSEVKELVVPSLFQAIKVLELSFCTNLSKITFEKPSKLIAIESYAFEGCSALKSVVLPKSLKQIGDFAFKDNVSLEKLVISDSDHGDIISIGDNAFEGTSEDLTIYVPEEHYSTYIKDPKWSRYSNKIKSNK